MLNNEQKKSLENHFIKQTAIDYDMDYETVKDIYRMYYPDTFYEKLEEYIKYFDQ